MIRTVADSPSHRLLLAVEAKNTKNVAQVEEEGLEEESEEVQEE